MPPLSPLCHAIRGTVNVLITARDWLGQPAPVAAVVPALSPRAAAPLLADYLQAIDQMASWRDEGKEARADAV